ncbi:MAG: hypothetical protein OXC03_03445 [Flavobacteriaceae bacterium]|nr:hypothetical protein [Flavobacteriaceae bacterium]
MIVIIDDTSILVDFSKLKLLHTFFSLNFQFHTTDFIFGEIFDPEKTSLQFFVDKRKLLITEIEGNAYEIIKKLNKRKPSISEEDYSIFYLARHLKSTISKNTILLTSDKKLRRFSEKKSIEVHGHLWVFDQMVENNILCPKTASKKLYDLSAEINEKLHLPIEECESRKKKWAEMTNQNQNEIK